MYKAFELLSEGTHCKGVIVKALVKDFVCELCKLMELNVKESSEKESQVKDLERRAKEWNRE